MATMFAGPQNVIVPKYDTQAKLIEGYSRNVKDYAINNIYTITTVKETVGKYLYLTPEEQGAVNSTTAASSEWVDGAPLPIMLEDGQKHEFKEYALRRYVRTFPIGWVTKQQAAWDIVASQSNVLANKLMTLRANDVYTKLLDSASYASSNTATATAAGGGKWDVATSANRYIQKSLTYGVKTVIKATMNGVKPDDLWLVVSPDVAEEMGASGEVADYLAQNPDATRYIQGDLFKNQLMNYGLPPRLYGINVVVDDLVKETRANIGATSSKSFVADNDSAFLIARPGSLNANAGGSNFSFIHCFMLGGEEMKVEVKSDPINERDIIQVSEWRQVKPVASAAGFLFTAVRD